MGFLTNAIWGVIILGIGVAIAMNVLGSLGTSLTGTASTAINTTLSAINTNLVGNYGLMVVIIVFVFILSLVVLLRRQGGGGGGI